MSKRRMCICCECGEHRPHVAHGLCRKCYSVSHHLTYSHPINPIKCTICGTMVDYGVNGVCKSCIKKLKSGTIDINGNRTIDSSTSIYLGLDIAENYVHSKFTNLTRMPVGNVGYDFITHDGQRIDVKSSCRRKQRDSWTFNIEKNTIADSFLCIAYDNRVDLNLMHIWLIPGELVNMNITKSISHSTVCWWDEFDVSSQVEL